MRYKVELIKTEEDYTVGCPELPGCWSEDNIEEEALENIKDAIREYVLAMDKTRRGDAGKRVLIVEVPSATIVMRPPGARRKPFKVRARKLGLPPFTNVNELIHLLECPRCNPVVLNSRPGKD